MSLINNTPANMDKSNYVFSPNLRLEDGLVKCENINLDLLQKELDVFFRAKKLQSSPTFVYSKAQLVENIRAYKDALEASGVQYLLGYSIKAHFNPTLLRIAKDEGCCAVTVSGHEIKLALDVGIQPEQIIFNGNGKQIWELELAISKGCLINIDSHFDLAHAQEVASKLDITAQILLRLNPNINSEVHEFLATGLASTKFGIDENQVADILDLITTDDGHVKLVGLHCHIGSTIDSTEVFSECLDVMLELVTTMKNKGCLHLKYLNLGGGLGINYRNHEHRTKKDVINGDVNGLNVSEMKVPAAGDLVLAVKERLSTLNMTLIVEPGRSIVGNAGVLLTKVIGVKDSSDIKYVVVDCSMNELIRPCLYSAYHHIELTDQTGASSTSTEPMICDIVGPVCECSDFLAKDRLLFVPKEGSNLVIFDAGAYCSTMSSNYNMRCRAAEILVDGSEWSVIRYPESYEDITSMFQ